MELVKRNILLNPGPGTTTDTVKYAQVVPDICPREKDFEDLMHNIRLDLAKVIHGENDYSTILFTGSGTAGDEAAICSAVPKGKKVLVVDNGAYGTRLAAIAKAYQIEVVEYKIPYGDYPDVKQIRKMMENDRNIASIAIVHHETTTGMLNPVREMIRAAHDNGVEVIMDSISAYAAIPINAKEWEIDYIVSTSNKCIQGMAGLSFVIVRKSLIDKLKDNQRSYYLDLYQQYQGFEKTRQMRFTPPVQVTYALRTAIDEFFAETQEGRTRRYTENWQTMYDGVIDLGFKMLLPYEQESKILMAIKEPTDTNYSFNGMHDFLYERGFTIYPGKGARESTFRLAVIGDLHKQDIVNFIGELKNYVRTNNITKF